MGFSLFTSVVLIIYPRHMILLEKLEVVFQIYFYLVFFTVRINIYKKDREKYIFYKNYFSIIHAFFFCFFTKHEFLLIACFFSIKSIGN